MARHLIDYGDVEGAFAKSAHRFAERFRLHKGGGHAIETRGVIVRFDPVDDVLTAWINTQMPHRAKAVLVAALGLAEHEVRVIVPDTGGGFGPKAVFHPEELAVPAAALLLGRPLKWIEDRRENFSASVMERDQDWDMEVAFDADGRLLAIRGRLCQDHGACTPYGVALPFNAGTNLVGPYVLPAYRLEIALCLTNMVPACPTRGAGRPQGTFVMERLLDRIAATLALPRDEVRRRNLIAPARMPFTTPIVQRDGGMMTYDSGDYPECQRRALAAAGWADFPARQQAARAEGRFIGIGLANYVEATGRGPFESAGLRIGPSGKVVVTTGATAQGQGTQTMLAQLVRDVLGVPPGRRHRGCGRHGRQSARARRVREPPGSDRRQCHPSRGGRRAREGDPRRRGAARSGARGSGAQGRRRAGERRAAVAQEPRRDRARARRRARLRAAGRAGAGTCRGDRLPAARAHLLQRHPRRRGRGRCRVRRGARSCAT